MRLVLAGLLTLMAASANAQVEDSDLQQTMQDSADTLEQNAAEIAGLRQFVDEAQFTALPAVEALNFEGKAIVEFAAEEIAFDLYSGVLRGAAGTLSARSGNAFDQSLMLVALLEEAGYDAAVLKSNQTPDIIKGRLAHAAMAERPHPAPLMDTDEAREQISILGQDMEASGRWADLALEQMFNPTEPVEPSERILSVANDLAAALPDDRPEIDFGAYYWVRYRLAPGRPWKTAHPALGGPAPESEPDIDKVLTGEIQSSDVHMLSIEMDIEILERGDLRQMKVMPAYRQPVATLLDQPVSISLSGALSDDSSQIGTLFRPGLNGEPAPDAQLFDLSGSTVEAGVLEMDPKAESMAGVFSGMGSQLRNATEKIRDGEEDQPLKALTGVILRVTWTTPSGKKRVEERWVIDRLANRHGRAGPPRIDLDQSPDELADKLNFQRDILVGAGGAHAGWTLAKLIDGKQLRMRHAAQILRAIDPDAPNGIRHDKIIPPEATHVPFLLTVMAGLDRPLAMAEGHMVHRDGPAIVSLHRSLEDQKDPMETDPEDQAGYIDIVMNPWRGLQRKDSHLAAWPQGAVIRGVHDTLVEASSSADIPGEDYFALHDEATPELIRKAGDLDMLVGDARTAAAHDLDEGFTLAMLSPDAAQPRWWRVSASGETIGRSALGGQSSAEYAVQAFTTGFTVVTTTNSLKKCITEYSGRAQKCCFAQVGAMAAVGAVGGGAASGKILSYFDEVGKMWIGPITDLYLTAGSYGVGKGAGSLTDSLCGGPDSK